MDSNVATLDSAECRVVLTAATSVATQLVAQLWQVQGAELGTVLGLSLIHISEPTRPY